MSGQVTKIYKDQGGDRMVAANGGVINLEAGSELQVAGVNKKSVLDLGIQALAAGKKLAWGTIALDGSGATPVATGLTTIEVGFAFLKKATTPGDDPIMFTTDWAAGNLSIYPWKNDGADPTLVASTATDTVGWIAIGD